MLFTLLGLSSGYFLSNSQHQYDSPYLSTNECDNETESEPVRGATKYYRMLNQAKKHTTPIIRKSRMIEYRKLAIKKGIQF